MDDYLQKPVTPSDLAAMLEKWLPPESGEATKEPQNCGTGILPVRDKKNMGKMPVPLKATEADVSPAVQQACSQIGSPTSDAKIWDSTVLLERMSGDAELEKKMLESFLAFMPQQISALKTAVAAGDLETSTRQAHSIKGATANVGGEAMRAVAAGMETAGRSADLDGIKSRLTELDQAYEQLKDAITQNR